MQRENIKWKDLKMTNKDKKIITAELYTRENASTMSTVEYIINDIEEIALDLFNEFQNWDYAIATDSNDENAWCIINAVDGVEWEKIPF